MYGAVFLAALVALPAGAIAQGNENGLPTQTLVRVDSKSSEVLTPAAVSLEVEGKAAAVTSVTPLRPGGTQVALLIDDGLSRSAGIQLNDLRAFATSLPPDTELLIGYMQNGTVQVEVPFTTDHAAAAEKIRVPTGIPGESASPYFCLDEFVKHWPGVESMGEASPVKARLVMMLTNGVDLYNGSTSIMNQDSPYVQNAQRDAERAGVAVSSIYYSDAGFRGRGSFSGQSYLQQVADATGGVLYNEGTINPVSLTPLFKQFVHDMSETYVATFNADPSAGGRDHLARLKMNSTIPKLKLRHAEAVRPGNRETGTPAVAQMMPPQ
jgi:hypothetical protein